MTSKAKRNKRELILEAAVQVFSSKGYHNTRMEEIAQVAGIGKGTIYEYFRGKLQLFQEMIEHSLRIYFENIEPDTKEQMTLEDRLRLIFEAHLKLCLEHKEMIRILFWDTDVIDEELRDWGEKMRRDKERRLMEIVREGMKRGEIRELDPYLAVLNIIGCLTAMWAPITLDGWEIEPKLLAGRLTDMIMNGIGK